MKICNKICMNTSIFFWWIDKDQQKKTEKQPLLIHLSHLWFFTIHHNFLNKQKSFNFKKTFNCHKWFSPNNWCANRFCQMQLCGFAIWKHCAHWILFKLRNFSNCVATQFEIYDALSTSTEKNIIFRSKVVKLGKSNFKVWSISGNLFFTTWHFMLSLRRISRTISLKLSLSHNAE